MSVVYGKRVHLGGRRNNKASLFTKVAYVNSKVEDTTAAADNKETDLPLTVGLEYDAASWLTLRGSVAQSLYSKVDDGTVDGTKEETTSVAAGASLKFGELTVDGMIGNNGGASDNTSAGTGQLRTDSLMSRVSMTYRF